MARVATMLPPKTLERRLLGLQLVKTCITPQLPFAGIYLILAAAARVSICWLVTTQRQWDSLKVYKTGRCHPLALVDDQQRLRNIELILGKRWETHKLAGRSSKLFAVFEQRCQI